MPTIGSLKVALISYLFVYLIHHLFDKENVISESLKIMNSVDPYSYLLTYSFT